MKLKKSVKLLAKTGNNSRIIRPQDVHLFIDEDLDKLYHRQNLCLKVFHRAPYPLEMNIYECTPCLEHAENIVESTKIQNIFARYNLAPRVYDLLFLVDNGIKYVAQVTDYIEGNRAPKDDKEAEPLLTKVKALLKDKNITAQDLFCYNFRESLLTDFQGYQFDRCEGDIRRRYREAMIGRLRRGMSFGGDKDIPYQSIEELQIKGRRDNLARNHVLQLDKVEGTVLDFGCNSGYFLRRAFDHGASYGVGVEVQKMIEPLYELFNYLGYFNTDFFTEIPDMEFDTVFFLSMADHFPFEEVVKHCKHTMYFEGHAHGVYTVDYCVNLLKKHFKEVSVLGASKEGEAVERVIVKGVK